MQQYTVQLKRKSMVAAGTLELTLDRPAGFTFSAGQFVTLRISDPDFQGDASHRGRSMSIASAPFETDLKIVMRVPEEPSPYKRYLMEAAVGTTFEIRGPFGHFTLHEDVSRPAVFIAGGIGITPFRSMILEEAHAPRGYRMLLIYSNRDHESAAYFDELRAVSLPGYRQICTMTRMEPAAAAAIGCETGYITATLISRETEAMRRPIYYIVGLPDMVTTVKKQLIESGIPATDIKIELYPGYIAQQTTK